MNKYSYDEVYNSLLEVMSSKPKEYKYDAGLRICRYFEWAEGGYPDYTKPSCIVGHVLALLGEESIIIASNNTTDMIALLPGQELFDQKSILLLCKAQEYQDKRETWHHAVHEAEIYVRGQWDS